MLVKKTLEAKPSKISLQQVLIIPFVIEILLIASLVAIISYQNGQRSVNEVAYLLRSEITENIRQHLDSFLATPHQVNAVNANAISQGLLPASDADSLEKYLFGQIQIFETLTSIYFANQNGGLVDAGREGAEGDLYVILTEGFSRGVFMKYAVDEEGEHQEVLATVPDFDARTRLWYTNAVSEGGATWSDVYILFTGQDMAVSASRPVYDQAGNLQGVVSSDIFLSHISNFLRELEIGETGIAFVLERSGELIASSTGSSLFISEGERATQRRLTARESLDPLISATAVEILDIYGSYEALGPNQQFEFSLGRDRQLVQVSSMQDEFGIDWLVVVVIPESDFTARITAGNRITIGLVAVSVLVAVIMGILTARYVTDPILKLNTATGAIAAGQMEISTGSPWILEIDQLAGSYNHMVDRLRSTLQDLRVEIEERKQAQQSLQKRIGYEEGIAACSKALLEDSPNSLENALQELLEAVDVSRIYVYRNVYRDGLLCMERVAEVHQDGDYSMENQDIPECMPYEKVWEGMVSRLSAGEAVGGSVEDFPASIRAILRKAGVRSSLALPIHMGGYWFGFLGFDDCRSERIWKDQDVRLFTTAAELFSSFMERVQTERILREKTAEQETLLDTMDAQVWYLTDYRTYGMANLAHAAFYGLDKDQIQYKQIEEFLPLEIAEEYYSRNLEVFHSKKTLTTETWIASASGKERLLVITKTPSLDENGEVGYVVCVATDNTERVLMEQQMRQQDRLAAVGQLAAGIAHDFNNIITSIVLYTQMSLQNNSLPEKLRERLLVIEEQADRASDLVQQILDFSRQAVLRFETMNLASVLPEISRMLERTMPGDVLVELDMDDSDVRIKVDPTRFQQVVVNLALNARDAMPDGGTLQIHLSRLENAPIQCDDCGVIEGGSWAVVEVRDTGSGIAPDVLPNIMDPFFTTKAPQGHGLGLAQVYGILKQHNGHLEVRTELGRGTSVVLYWPLACDDQEPVSAVQSGIIQGSGELLLLAEDHESMRNAMVDALSMLGYRVLSASNGRDALEVCEQYGEQIALVISDWVMPGMGGRELASELMERKIPVPILLLTGHPLDRDARSNLPPNVTGFLMKPPALDALAREVSRVLGKGSNPD